MSKINTKAESYKEFNSSFQRITDCERGFQFMLKNDIAVTSRSLASAINVERTSATRILFDLVEEGKVYEAHNAPCPITKRKVKWYRVTPTLGQGKLFGINKPSAKHW